MSFCPKCNAVIDLDAVECPRCHYDFNPTIDDETEATTLRELLIAYANERKATCPSCDAEIAMDATKCNDCGYDFNPKSTVEEFAYSNIAQAILFIAFVIQAIFQAIWILIGSYLCILIIFTTIFNQHGLRPPYQWMGSLAFVFFYFPILVILGLAQLIIFTRVMDMKKD